MSDPGAVPAPAGELQLDGAPVPFAPGQTILQAARAAGHDIAHLCFHPDFRPHGSCRLCTVEVGGRHVAACTTPAGAGMAVRSHTPALLELRRTLLQMLFVEGNHFCPACEKSGNCKLQALAYACGLESPRFIEFFPDRPLDATHPDILLDFNRCILCELCVRASAEVDRKHVFALAGRGLAKHLVVNAESGLLGDSAMTLDDKAMTVCPVGVILRKRRGFAQPIGQRRYDLVPLPSEVPEDAP